MKKTIVYCNEGNGRLAFAECGSRAEAEDVVNGWISRWCGPSYTKEVEINRVLVTTQNKGGKEVKIVFDFES